MRNLPNENAQAGQGLGVGSNLQTLEKTLPARSTTLPSAFNFETSTPIRVVMLAGEPWFVGRDVADALGYSNPQKAVRDHCKSPRPVGKGVNESFTLDPQTVIVSEPDLLRLIVKSELPSAERFEQWVFEEVLPSIRRTGRYAMPTIPENYADALRLAADQADRIALQAAQIEHQRPAVEFVSKYVDATGTASIRATAKIINRPEREFIAALVDGGVLYRLGEDLVPMAVYQRRGYFVVRAGEAHGHSYQRTRFTARGIEWAAKRYGAAQEVSHGD